MTDMLVAAVYATDTGATLTAILTANESLEDATRVDLLTSAGMLAEDATVIDVDGPKMVVSWSYNGSLSPGEHLVYARVTRGGKTLTSHPMRLRVMPDPIAEV